MQGKAFAPAVVDHIHIDLSRYHLHFGKNGWNSRDADLKCPYFLDKKPERSPTGTLKGIPVDPKVSASISHQPQIVVTNPKAPPALKRFVGSRPSPIRK